jgi:hypothetical protein
MMDLAAIVLGTLGRQDAATLADVDGELFESESLRPDESMHWLRDVLAFIAGDLTHDRVIARRLREGRTTAALRFAARSLARGVAPSADTERELDLAWNELRAQAERNRRLVKEALARVSADAPASAAAARRHAEPLETLRVPDARPRKIDDVDNALATLDAVRRIRENVDTHVEAAGHEADDFRRRLREAAAAALGQLMDRWAVDRDGSERTATVLRALPELILSRRLEELERLAVEDVDEDFFRQIAASAARPPSVHPPPVGLSPSTERARLPVQLSLTSRALLESVRDGDRQLDGEWDLEAVERAVARGPSEDAWRKWLEVAKSASDETIRLRALGEGLFHAGRFYFVQQGQVRLATMCLRDALMCLARTRTMATSQSLERTVAGLLASTAAASVRPVNECRSWWDSPETCFEWIASTNHFELVGRLWAETSDDAAANEVFGVAGAMLGPRPQLHAACARELVTTQRLRSDPDLVIHRIKQLVAPAGATPELDEACDDLARELGTLRAERTPSVQISRPVTRIVECLQALRRDTTAPVPTLVNVLPEAVRPLVVVPQPGATPMFKVHERAGAFFPSETNGELHLPLLVQAMEEGAPAEDVFLEIATTNEPPGTDRVKVEDKEIPLGNLDPGEEVERRVRVYVPPDLALEAIATRFRVKVRQGNAVLTEAVLSVPLRGHTRRGERSPYNTGTSVSGAHFFGREKERRKILDALLGDDVQRTPLVVGIRRIGKTSLLKVVQESDDILRRYNPVYYSPEDRPTSTTAAEMLRILAERIREGVPRADWKALRFQRDAFRDGDPYEAFEAFCASVNRIALQRRVLLILDEFDRLLELAQAGERRQAASSTPFTAHEVFQTEVFGALRKLLLTGGNVSLIIAGLPALLDTGYRDRLFGLLLPVHIRSLRTEEARMILDASQNVMRFAPNAVDRIFLATGLQPYLLQLTCHFLFARLVQGGRETVTVADVDEVIDEDILPNESYFADYRSLVEDRMVELLRAMHRALKVTVNRRFVSVQEIAHELGRGASTVRLEELRATLDELSDDTRQERPLVTRAPNAPGRYRLSIGMLGDHLERAQAYYE